MFDILCDDATKNILALCGFGTAFIAIVGCGSWYLIANRRPSRPGEDQK